MDPDRLPADWPYRAKGHKVRLAPHDWWYLDIGPKDAPVILMLHGAGGSGHSFGPLIPFLEDEFRLIVPDLPGQGCTRAGGLRRFGLDAMAEDLGRLCTGLGTPPVIVLGHSAGAAIALRMAEMMPLKGVVGINAALGSFDGAAGVMFPLLARALAVTPFVGKAVARLWGTPGTVARLLASTGSPLDPPAREHYLRLVRDDAHVEGTLAMMAAWKLDGLMARLPSLSLPVLLIASDRDRAVPAAVSRDAARHMPGVQMAEIEGFGHLVHEEAPSLVAGHLLPWLRARL